MTRTIRRVLISLGVAAGIVVAVSAPAFAGLSAMNHSEPVSQK